MFTVGKEVYDEDTQTWGVKTSEDVKPVPAKVNYWQKRSAAFTARLKQENEFELKRDIARWKTLLNCVFAVF